MRISEETIDRAFAAFHVRYVVTASQAWDLDHHVKLWADARASVESDDDVGFQQTLRELRSHWQIARGNGAQMLSVEHVLPLLRSKAAYATTKRLSELTLEDAGWLFRLVNDVADIKRVNGEPSIMAISKVLHFFNPRLFVIVDRAMLWDWMLAHRRIWQPIEEIRRNVDASANSNADSRDDGACDVASYVAILICWGNLLKTHQGVMIQFASFLRGHTTEESTLPIDIEHYEAAAVEWLLSGVVELPPVGLNL